MGCQGDPLKSINSSNCLLRFLREINFKHGLVQPNKL